MQCVFILIAFITNPFLYQNQPSRESIFCGRVGVWWITRALIMLKFLLKRRQNLIDERTRIEVDKGTSWREDELKRGWVNERMSWWEDELTGEQVDGGMSWRENKLMREQVDERTSWRGELMGGRVRILRGESIFSPFHLFTFSPFLLFTPKWYREILVTCFALRKQAGHTPSPLLALCHCREFVWPAYVFCLPCCVLRIF